MKIKSFFESMLNKNYCENIILPTFVLGAVTGSATAVVIVLYKYLASKAIWVSDKFYQHFNKLDWFLPAIFLSIFGFAVLFAKVYEKYPNVKGGGIPTSIGVLRGLYGFKWVSNLIGSFFLSLICFLIGVPLGSEGPSVQMGTALGKGAVSIFAKKRSAWDRYVMTGGACSGFSSATGASLSGVVFAIEEAHGRISPMIIMVSVISVMFSRLVSEILSPIFSVSVSLFPDIEYAPLTNGKLWLPLVIGIALGLFAVLFLKFYGLLASLYNKIPKKIPTYLIIFAIFMLTVMFGKFSPSFVSTGHELVVGLFRKNPALIALCVLLIFRTILTLVANISGLTGGIFLPILALGAVLAGAFGEIFFMVGFSQENYSLILSLGMVGCIAGMMKMPLTAILFGIEALGLGSNVLFVLVCSISAYLITELFKVKSISDYVLEHRISDQNKGKISKTVEQSFVIEENSFAEEKEIRDIFWPNSLMVLSVKKADAESESHALEAGDTITVRYTTFDEEKTVKEINAIICKHINEKAPNWRDL